MVVMAHPDDAEFTVAGTVAAWVKAGCRVIYVLCTDGNAGSQEPGMTREKLAEIRRTEQRAACATLGVSEVEFLGYDDGQLQPSLDLRRDLVRAIRQHKPEVMICWDPTVHITDTFINHPDHRAAAQAALDAVAPSSAMPLLWPETGAPHRVRQVYIYGRDKADTWVDIAETIEQKIAALKQHASQMGDWDPTERIKEWSAEVGKDQGLAYAESYKVITLEQSDDTDDEKSSAQEPGEDLESKSTGETIMTQPLVSPQLTHLQQALEAGEAKALDDFWRQVTEQGTPLIEAIEGNNDHSLVTLLWRAEGEIENVVVIGRLMDWPNNQMTRLLDTDLWYKTYRVRNDVRTTYQLAPNDPGVPLGLSPNRAERTANWQTDPLNPHTYIFPKDDEFPESVEMVRSVIEMPGAPAQLWIEPRDGVPTGKVEMHRLKSDILDNERRVWVYMPPGYTTDGEPYGLLILFDGWAYVEIVPTPTILDNLLSEGLIPPLVAVLPDSLDGATRLRELLLHSPFNDFLAQELVPWTRTHYHVTSDPAQTIVGGSSAGGLAAGFAALEHPKVFGNVLSQSGAFRWKPEGEDEHEWLARQFVAREKLPLKFYIEAGVLEVNSLLALGDGPNLILSNRHLRDVLQAKGYPVHYAEFAGGHDYLCWQGTLAEGVLALIGKEAT